MRIDVVATPSRYEAFWNFSRHLHSALLRAGIESTFYDQQPGDSLKKIVVGMKIKRPDAVIGFNILFNITAQIFQGISIPNLMIFVDWPIYFPPLFADEIKQDPDFYLGFTDQDCCNFLQMQDYQRTFYCPHAIEKEAVSESLEPMAREFDVVYPSSFVDPNSMYKELKIRYSAKMCEFLAEIVEEALASRDIPLTTLLSKGLEDNEHLKEEAENTLVKFTMNWMRGLDRVRLLKEIRGVQVHLFIGQPEEAKKWKKLVGDKTELVFHPNRDFSPTFRIVEIFIRGSKTIKDNSMSFL